MCCQLQRSYPYLDSRNLRVLKLINYFSHFWWGTVFTFVCLCVSLLARLLKKLSVDFHEI